MTRYAHILLLFGSLLTCSFSDLLAQANDLTKDSSFFESQSQLYQTWLDREGIGEHLSFRELDVKPDKLSLFLEFTYTDLDSLINAWEQ